MFFSVLFLYLHGFAGLKLRIFSSRVASLLIASQLCNVANTRQDTDQRNTPFGGILLAEIMFIFRKMLILSESVRSLLHPYHISTVL